MKLEPRSEETEQQIVATWLRYKHYLFSATANGVRTGWKQAVRLKRTGLVAGLPDLLIFERPIIHIDGCAYQRHRFRTKRPDYLDGDLCDCEASAGVAIEMKREGSSPSRVSFAQKGWIEELEKRGWLCKVARGAREAITWLEGLGL